jgi:hypothetical protein
VALVAVGCMTTCGPRREYIYLDAAPGSPPPGAVTPPTSQTTTENPTGGDRCGRVCLRIGNVGGELINAPWFQACVRSCHEHASEGQLECYERVERSEDLEACTVR